MTEQHDDQHDDVRRLLADARHDEPIPADVAARLDDVLAGLAAQEPVRTEEPAAVVDLETRRRRGRVRTLFVAAAAVAAVGVGVSQLDIGGITASDSLQSADGGSADSGGQAASESDTDSAAEPAAPRREASDELERATRELGVSRLVVDDDDFADVAARKALAYGLTADVLDAEVQGSSAAPPTDSGQEADQGGGPTSGDAPTAPGDGAFYTANGERWEADTCGAGPYGRGRLLLVTYRRHPAVLAVRPPVGDSTVVDLLRCGTGEVLRSATVPTP